MTAVNPIRLYGVDPTLPESKVEIKYKSFRFSAGEKQVRLPDLRSYERVVIEAFFPSDEQIFEIMLLRNAIRVASNVPVTLSLPYLPYSRQDRACHPGEAFGLQVLMNSLNLYSQGVDGIVTWDVHSKVAETLARRAGNTGFKNVTAEHFVRRYIQSNPGVLGTETLVIAPDKGAKDRAEVVHQELKSKYPILYAEKKRDPNDGSILETILPDVDQAIAPSGILIVDDICDGGRTFIELAKVIRKQLYCEEITLYVTHALFSKGFNVFFENGKVSIDRVISPNFFRDPSLSNSLTKFVQI